MENKPVSKEYRAPVLDRYMREEIAKELWRDFQTVASRLVITFDSHAIQAVAFPPTGESFRMPAFGPVTGVMKDGVYSE